jgi:DNA-binding response OmpR family regulator
MARILVADDSPSVRLLVRRHLESDGHEVVEAPDGTTAYELGSAGGFDLAILDQLMPGMLGLDILHRWRGQDIDMPVLLLSAVDDDATVVQSLELGAFDYMRKPFSIPELKARLATHLPRQKPQPDPGATDTEA